ncbi:MAG: hypothetical protein C0622_12070 [Desulfuromonas sp.]|nr:MAG: hypothetical protein C0622_12070 [Desulfuromonas sp.]
MLNIGSRFFLLYIALCSFLLFLVAANSAAALDDATFLQQAQQPVPDELISWMSADPARKQVLAEIESLLAMNQKGPAIEAADKLQQVLDKYLDGDDPKLPAIDTLRIKREQVHGRGEIYGDEGVVASLYRQHGDMMARLGNFPGAEKDYGLAFREYERLIPGDPRLIPLAHNQLNMVLRACSTVPAQRRNALNLPGVTRSPLYEVGNMGTESRAELSCLMLPFVIDRALEQWEKNFGDPAKTTSVEYAKATINYFNQALSLGFYQYVGNKLMLNDFVDGEYKEQLDTYIPEPGLPLFNQVEYRVHYANQMSVVMMYRKQPQRAISLIQDLSNKAANAGERVVALELGAAVHGRLLQGLFTKEANQLVRLMREELLPGVDRSALDATQQPRLAGFEQWLATLPMQ